MNKDVTVTIRLDIADVVRLEKLLKRCEAHPWIINPSKSEVFRYALRFLCELDDTSFYRIIANRGLPNPFEVKMKTE